MRVISIKWKLRTCTIQIQKEKVWFFAKKNFFWNFRFFFLWCQNRQKNFFPFFKNSKNKPQKWLSWNHSNINRNKVMNFGGRSSYPAETARPFMVIRAIMAPPWHLTSFQSLTGIGLRMFRQIADSEISVISKVSHSSAWSASSKLGCT